ncbi:MAG TPA: 50S ribosomal protein L11 methyltransferase [Acidimicrobiales bacterium]|nr:50S ribosomal protein L11 methyltransferase [Acidimicrobiales bacterium]
MNRETPLRFLLASTEVQTHPFVPELSLHLAHDAFGLWEETAEAMGRGELAPPFWASVWPGGLALARYLLEHPKIVLGRTVIDVATGSGVVAIAAALAGARSVSAYDTDELAVHAAQMNACLNRVSVTVSNTDVRAVSAPGGALVTAGDVFYDRRIATAMLEGLTALARGGAEILIGDPYRLFLPQDRLEPLANFDIGVDMFLESDPVKATLVARLS